MIHIPHIINESFVILHPQWIFIYGDNLLHKGEEGHRISFAHHKNAYPLPTKKMPCHRAESYMTDKEYVDNEKAIEAALNIIPWNGQFTVAIPGIGREEDDSLLYQKAPGTYAYLEDALKDVVDQYIIDYPTGM
jgi:hypothetical protein